ncbi:hypothetical protein N9M41_04040 [Rhodopirellula sp.]|nr:hypothetical protein [Rhodopirellula sp.]
MIKKIIYQSLTKKPQVSCVKYTGAARRVGKLASLQNSTIRFAKTLAFVIAMSRFAFGVGGELTVSISEEDTDTPTIARFEMHRVDAPNKTLPIRRTVPAGIGVILDRELLLEMPEANYLFKLTRGPEYRLITGTFALERSSLDSHHVQLPRMANLLEEGWVSGDCATPASDASLPLRMASEDCHVAASIGEILAKPIAGRDEDDPIVFEPSWTRSDLQVDDGIAFYGVDSITTAPNARDIPTTNQGREDTANGDEQTEPNQSANQPIPGSLRQPLMIERILAADQAAGSRVAIENPFAWPLPVWLASERIDGIFLMGDWLRFDRQVKTLPESRPPQGPSVGDGRTLGRWAEKIYWNLLEAGFRLPPLAGTGDQCGKTPVGYNRLYVAADDQSPGTDHPLHVCRPDTNEAWWQSAWKGKSVVTNGPLLRPKLAGRVPGYVFTANRGEKLVLQPELNLSVRDPVEYLEVIHNGEVHYSARLDEFAKAGGVIPSLEVEESGWVTMRVATLHEDHFRAALSAPWYIEFDSKPRITTDGVKFFQTWQAEYEARLAKLPSTDIQRHAPYVIASRQFWSERLAQANADR